MQANSHAQDDLEIWMALARSSRNLSVIWSSSSTPNVSPRAWEIRCLYSGYIIRILVTFEEMFILCMILTNETMETHGCGNNHHLLLYWVTRHPVKYSPLLFQHTKRVLYHIANTWMQMVEMLLLTIWNWPSPPIWHMIPLTLAWWQVSRSICVPNINHIIFACTHMSKMKVVWATCT
jgi:hypothetical protein